MMKTPLERISIVFFAGCIVLAVFMFGKNWTAIDLIKGTADTTNKSSSIDSDDLTNEDLTKLSDELADADKYDYAAVTFYDEDEGTLKFTFNQKTMDFEKFVKMCSNASEDTLKICEKYGLEIGSVLVYQEADNKYIAWTSEDAAKGTLGYNADTTGNATENFQYVKGITPETMKKRLEAGDLFTAVG